jgi:hypothetical protein
MLDFVLDNPDEEYLEEETDKIQFFTEQRSISRDLLPTRTYEAKHGPQNTVRFFVDKSPMFLDGSRPVFTYFENEYESPTSFPAHLEWYRPLLKALEGQYKFIYVGSLEKNFGRAQSQFRAVLTGQSQVHNPGLLSYFRLRKLWEAKDLEKLSPKDYATLNQAEKRFSGPEHEQLYQLWLKNESSALNQLSASQHPAQSCGMFETCLITV